MGFELVLLIRFHNAINQWSVFGPLALTQLKSRKRKEKRGEKYRGQNWFTSAENNLIKNILNGGLTQRQTLFKGKEKEMGENQGQGSID